VTLLSVSLYAGWTLTGLFALWLTAALVVSPDPAFTARQAACALVASQCLIGVGCAGPVETALRGQQLRGLAVVLALPGPLYVVIEALGGQSVAGVLRVQVLVAGLVAVSWITMRLARGVIRDAGWQSALPGILQITVALLLWTNRDWWTGWIA